MENNQVKQQCIRLIQTGQKDNIHLAILIASSQQVDLNDFWEDCSKLLKGKEATVDNLATLFSSKEIDWSHHAVILPSNSGGYPQPKDQKEPIHILPKAIGYLQQLEILYLRNNQLHQLPPQIGLLKNLRKLYISNNQLSKLPPQIGRLYCLEVLELSVNHIRQLPNEVHLLQQLKKLDLFFNPILDKEVHKLQKHLPKTAVVSSFRA
ncbi:MAG: leucine-rich repeat domain-containing protein [Aureispira sp.]|nr:leucine-rich repeat domain-containing protein [Aureispira sp.]